MRQMSIGAKFFAGIQVSLTQKKGMKKADSLSCLRKKLQEIMDKAVPETTKKSQKVRDEII